MENELNDILNRYKLAFKNKEHPKENLDSDVLMRVFSITPSLKHENRQYWGRELGKCWELLVRASCKEHKDFQPALRFGQDEPCDFVIGNYAIDTKYRVGSGDSGTLKKFKEYGYLLRENGYTPVFLFLREDNLPAAITACKAGQWDIYMGDESFEFIKSISKFDLKSYLVASQGMFSFAR